MPDLKQFNNRGLEIRYYFYRYCKNIASHVKDNRYLTTAQQCPLFTEIETSS